MTSVFSEALGAILSWLPVALGKSDYRIVRLVFFSTIAAWVALDLMRTLARVAHGLKIAVVANLPPLPEVWCLLGWMSREEYDRRAYPALRSLERAAARIKEAIERGRHV